MKALQGKNALFRTVKSVMNNPANNQESPSSLCCSATPIPPCTYPDATDFNERQGLSSQQRWIKQDEIMVAVCFRSGSTDERRGRCVCTHLLLPWPDSWMHSASPTVHLPLLHASENADPAADTTANPTNSHQRKTPHCRTSMTGECLAQQPTGQEQSNPSPALGRTSDTPAKARTGSMTVSA